MTIATEYIPHGDWDAVERFRLAIESGAIDTGGVQLGIRIGTATATWSGPTTTIIVDHGLGRSPAGIFIQGQHPGNIDYGPTSWDENSILVAATRLDGATTDVNFIWGVLG